MTEAELQPLVTRCPDCATQFKVSEAQLQVANGKVRCGSCLAVFEGVDNLVWDSEFDANESADVTLDDLLDELKDDATGGASAAVESAAAATGSAPQLEMAPPDLEAEQAAGTGDQPAPTPPPSAAPEIVLGVEFEEEETFDRELAASQIIAAAEAAAAQTEPAATFALEHIEVPPEEELLDLGSSYIGPDYASLKRSEDQQEEAKQRSRNRREAMAEMRALAEQREAEDAASPIDEGRIADTPAAVPAVAEADLAAAKTSAYPKDEELEQVWERKPEPVAIPSNEKPADEPLVDAPAGRSWRIPLVAGALVLLVSQIMYLQFDDWAVNPTFRPAYAAACGALPCELPDRRALDLLKSRALKVRSHPRDEGALLVDALIVNEAEFDQPFPNLHLKFTSVEGNPLASERFSPDDYLAGDMAGVKMMPARTPVHIEVKAVDPGPSAVSYTLDFE